LLSTTTRYAVLLLVVLFVVYLFIIFMPGFYSFEGFCCAIKCCDSCYFCIIRILVCISYIFIFALFVGFVF
jgi:hypothetical protein